MTNIVIYDCPTWDTNKPERGSYITHADNEGVLLCDYVSVKGKLHVIFRKTYSIKVDNQYVEIWVKGTV